MRRTAASLFVLGALVTASGASAQSFDCKSPRYADEQVICRDSNLAKLDSQLARAFAASMNQLTARERKDLADEEEDWVVARRQCGPDPRCIAEEYRNRIHELTGVMPPPVVPRPNPPVVAVAPREPAEQLPREAAAPPPPPPISERPPQPVIGQPPFPIVERWPQPLVGGPPFPPVERPPQAVVERPSQPVIVEKQAPTPAAERQSKIERQQMTVETHESVEPERRAQPNPEAREQSGTDDLRPQPKERKQPAANTSAAKEERQERRSPAPEARRATETSPPPESGTSDRDTEVVKTTAKAPQHKAKQNRAANAADAAAAASTAAAAPNPPRTASVASPAAPIASTPTKPSIQWIDPPPR